MLPDATDASAAVDADATRRAFLKKVAIGGAAAAIGTQVLPFDRLVPGAAGQEEGETEVALSPDEEIMTFLAGLALAGAAAYRAAVGDEGSSAEEDEAAEPTTTLPPIQVPELTEPVVELLRGFGAHHSQQAAALGGTLSTAVDAPNGTLLAEVRSALGGASDEGAVLTTLRQMEERLAATHLAAVGDLTDTTDASLVATALGAVSQHALVLGRVGSTPAPLEELVPELQTDADAIDVGQYPVEASGEVDTPSTEPDANEGGQGADPETDTDQQPGDGTEESGS